ncbi:hypothetical protein AK830_g10043 [Neonectria ditissima]|uniref:ADP-ribosylation factor 6 n=1 Tax=Neonectria ditissima TaxID=78410 RepID=A0A0P7ATS6_9HYPO|nr:hypothetical protein AK830_g10043 [Neonectria ditissima]
MRIGRWVLGEGREHTGVLLGSDAAGKTTFLYQLKLGEMVSAIPTIGFNIETIEYPDGGSITFWDTGGMQRNFPLVLESSSRVDGALVTTTGCDKIRPLIRHYIHKDRFLVFLHDCTDSERLDYSIEQLHSAAGWMAEFGCPYMWILFNKQDLLPPSERDSIVAGLRSRFESELSQYQDRHRIKIMDTPGLSAASRAQLDPVMKEIRQTLGQIPESSRETTKAQVKELERGPSEQELVERIKKANAESAGPDQFYQDFVRGNLDSWDHYAHLRAGHFVMFEGLSRGSTLLDCATLFLSRLEQLRLQNPERFRNTAHRTMTIFWLYQLQLATVAYQIEKKLVEFPSSSDFGSIMLLTPSLMNSGLWRTYYSKDLMFSPGARDNWHLPDLQPLPSFQRETPSSTPSAPASAVDHYRLPRFAFSVVQKTLSSNLRRGGVVKQALAALQSSTMRLRATDPSVPPYSETQAYFWIQLIHASLKSLEMPTSGQSLSSPIFDGSVTMLTFEAFKTLFDITGEEWRRHYTPSTWESIPARMSFVNPDLKALPNVFASPSKAKVDLARMYMANAITHRFTRPAELPPREELDFSAAIVIDEANLMPEGSLNVVIHASLLQYLHRQLSTTQSSSVETEKRGPSGMVAARTALALSEILGSTQSMFWVQQAQISLANASRTLTFEEFVTKNPQLAYEDLPFLYYSPELWWSTEAKEVFVPPDRRPLSSVVSQLASA